MNRFAASSGGHSQWTFTIVRESLVSQSVGVPESDRIPCICQNELTIAPPVADASD